MLGAHNAVWDDGEWVSWADIDRQIQYKEWGVKYPNADRTLVPIFEDLLTLAEYYHQQTGRHLNVYGDIGELYGAITLGIRLHRNYAQGSDGRLGNDFVEVKTITPFKIHDKVLVKRAGSFNKVLIVKINEDFEICSHLICRKDLKKGKGKNISIRWKDYSNN